MHKLRALLGPLRVFDAVCRTGGVSRAAEVLHVTPGAVSQQVKQLESLLGAALFSRDSRELEPTTAGRRLAVRVAELFDRIEAAAREVSEISESPRLRLKVIPSFAIRWLVPRLASFYAAHPEIELELATVSRIEDLRLGQADFMICHGVGEWTDFHFDHVFDDAFIPVCSPGMASRISTLEHLLKNNLLHSMMRPGDWEIWLASVGMTQAPPKGGTSLGNAALCYQAAADGLGVAIAQLEYVAEDLRCGRLKAPIDHVARTDSGYYLLCDPRTADTYPHKPFREWMRSVREAQPALQR